MPIFGVFPRMALTFGGDSGTYPAIFMLTLGMFLLLFGLFLGGVWWACANEDLAK